MAIVAVLATRDVRWVFARRRNAIVAGATGAKNLRVVNSEGWCPDVGIVAVLADFSCQYVCRIFARRFDSVMAAGAVACDPNMIEVSGQPAGRCVAVITLIVACDVGRVFTGSRDAIMTRPAGAEDLRVVNACDRSECDGAVAVLADIRRLHMDRALTDSRYAVMAGNAVTDDSRVIEYRR